MYILEAFSGSIKRVCRSTLAAEANGFLSGVEAGEYLRSLVMELLHPDVALRDLDQLYLKKKIMCFTDARSLEQTLNKDAGQPQDKRVRILIAQVRQMIGENTYDDDAPALQRGWTPRRCLLMCSRRRTAIGSPFYKHSLKASGSSIRRTRQESESSLCARDDILVRPPNRLEPRTGEKSPAWKHRAMRVYVHPPACGSTGGRP